MAKLVLLLLLSLPAATFNSNAVSYQGACTHRADAGKASVTFVPLDILKMR
jgi:hypothetical protein